MAVRLARIAGDVRGVDLQSAQLGVEQAPRLGTGLPVGDTETLAHDVGDVPDLSFVAGMKCKALPPRREPDHLDARSGLHVRFDAAMQRRRVHGACLEQSERLLVARRPPRETDRWVVSLERPEQQGQRRVAAGNREARRRWSDTAYLDLTGSAAARAWSRPTRLGVGDGAGGKRRHKARHHRVVTGQREGDCVASHLCQEHATDRRLRARQLVGDHRQAAAHGRRIGGRAEELLDGRVECPRDHECQVEGGRPPAGLDPRDGLPRHVGRPGEIALRQAASQPGQPQSIVSVSSGDCH